MYAKDAILKVLLLLPVWALLTLPLLLLNYTNLLLVFMLQTLSLS